MNSLWQESIPTVSHLCFILSTGLESSVNSAESFVWQHIIRSGEKLLNKIKTRGAKTVSAEVVWFCWES